MLRQSPQSNYVNPLQSRLEHVEQQLEYARHTIIRFVPDEYTAILESYHSCKSTMELFSWRETAADQIVERVSSVMNADTYYGVRSDCPLCGIAGYGPSGGFTVPLGLKRHLTNFGNTQNCPVMEAAFELCRGYLQRKFGEAERKAEAEAKLERERQLELRRKTETLYRTHPHEPPALVDERHTSIFFDQARTTDTITWAEERVLGLGFTCHNEGNVKSFVLERPEYIVYADLSPAKKIRFNVFAKPLGKGKRPKMRTCDIPDSYKNDLGSKFEDRLKAAVESLRRR